jgi:hypothetical protein
MASVNYLLLHVKLFLKTKMHIANFFHFLTKTSNPLLLTMGADVFCQNRLKSAIYYFFNYLLHLDIIQREYAHPAIKFSFGPIGVDHLSDIDHVARIE